MKRLELARVRVCQRCGRGRAELEGPDGTALTIPLDAARATELERQGEPEDVAWLSMLVVEALRRQQCAVREVVLDAAEHGLRALVSIARGEEHDVVACTPQEGVGLAVRVKAPLYATAEAVALSTKTTEPSGHDTLH